ncbi:MAG: MMPL family transporter [Actinomycetaceae bacterium]|nr:MMPL family transporter [Actinomycetaceae bacterium]
MFDLLARGITRFPKLFIIGWVILALVGGTASLWGFGHGNIFDRMYSSESMVPGSESDEVILATGATGEGESIVVVVRGGIVPDDVSADLADFRAALEDSSEVATVHDPVTVNETFTTEIANEIDAAVAQAVADNQELIDGAAAMAVAENAMMIEGARMMGGDAAAAQAQAEIEEAARTAVIEEIETQARTAAEEEVADIANPADDFIADSGFVVAITLEQGEPEAGIEAVEAAMADFEAALQTDYPDADVVASSTAMAKDAIMQQTAKDLVVGEAVGLPIALFLLLVVFGGVLAAGLPLTSALTAIGIGIGGVWMLTFVFDVDNFILNIVSLVGLALSIDYGLLVVSRYREEISEQLAKRDLPRDGTKLPDDIDQMIVEAVQETVRTAGRTVSFSALTIAFSIAGLFVINAPILKMIAIGGVIITVLAVATAVTFVPAAAMLLGKRLVVPSWLSRMPGMKTVIEKVGDSASDHGFFSRLAAWVHDRPWPVMIIATAVLVVMTLPIGGLNMRSNFTEYIPEGTIEKEAFETLQTDYDAFRTPSGIVLAYTDEDNTADLVADIEAVSGVTSVRVSQGEDDEFTTIDFFVDAEDQVGKEVTQAVKDIRDIKTEYRTDVGGAAALQLDFNNQLMEDAPLALAVVVVSVLFLLFLMTGSVIAPVKALIVNSLSLIAGMGAGVYVFENGLLGLPQTNGLETFVVAAAIAFGFGLAMDYEVFLLARIKEYWDAGYDNDRAVEMGLQRSGRIITSAAAIIVAVFVGFVFGDLLAVKQIGVVLAFIIIVDASIVRMLLVPATMTVLGKWNWWAPKPLKKIYEKFKIVH